MLGLSQTAAYAVRAVLYIAAQPRQRSVRVAEIAAALELPPNYLSKTLHQLARAGMLASARGPSGGFRLSVPTEELTLQRVAATFAAQERQRCLLGRGACGREPGCAVHARWAPVAAQLRDFFGTTTVADLLPTRHNTP